MPGASKILLCNEGDRQAIKITLLKREVRVCTWYSGNTEEKSVWVKSEKVWDNFTLWIRIKRKEWGMVFEEGTDLL